MVTKSVTRLDRKTYIKLGKQSQNQYSTEKIRQKYSYVRAILRVKYQKLK